ncbi:MAG TPA: DEAD/DEAH box helicase family protein [Candidatus Saccharimonadales bacterium]|nr:DEAD/DEAH box helicase family protein [Candidatus Saccharimonadales bacterium]
MKETGPQPEQMLDVAQAQYILGYEAVPLDPGQLRPGQVDERRTILQDALAAQEEMRQGMVSAARAAGIEVPAEHVAAWQPDERQLEALRARLSRPRKRARILDGFDDFINDQRMGADALGTPLRPHQQDMTVNTSKFFSRIPRNFAGSGKGGHIGAPPGVGKTGVTNTICAAAKYNEDPDERVKIVVIVDSVNVMNQTHGGEDAERGFGKFAPHLDVGMRVAESHDTSHDITIMPAASAIILMEKGEMPDADVVILDEVDEYGRGKPGEQLTEYCADKLTVGLSASVDEATRDLLPYEIYTMSLPEGIHMGLLAETTAEVLRVDIDLSKVRLPDDPALRKATIEQIKLRARLDDIKKRVQADIKRGVGGIIVRVPAGDDIEIAKKFAEELRSLQVTVPNDGSWPAQFKTIPRNIRALVIGGKGQTTKGGRRLQAAAFQSYEKGKTDVFVTVKAIRRGWDSMTADTLYDADTGGNWRDKLQVDGRVTRRVKGKRARIFNYYDEARPDQYTGVIALGGQPGQDKITVREEMPEIMPHRLSGERRVELLSSTLLEGLASVAVIESVSIHHDIPEQPAVDETAADAVTEKPHTPEQPVAGEPTAAVEMTADAEAANTENEAQEPEAGEVLTITQVATRLGVTEKLVADVYKLHGFSESDVVNLGDLHAMLELSHPSLLIRPLPETGYVADDVVWELAGIPKLRVLHMRTLAQYNGYLAKRFLRPDGTAGRYYRTDQVGEIVSILRAKQEKEK